MQFPAAYAAEMQLPKECRNAAEMQLPTECRKCSCPKNAEMQQKCSCPPNAENAECSLECTIMRSDAMTCAICNIMQKCKKCAWAKTTRIFGQEPQHAPPRPKPKGQSQRLEGRERARVRRVSGEGARAGAQEAQEAERVGRRGAPNVMLSNGTATSSTSSA